MIFSSAEQTFLYPERYNFHNFLAKSRIVLYLRVLDLHKQPNFYIII